VLTHESGIHTNCLLKDRNTYQLISAESVGRKEDDFLIGKHSGKATLTYYLNEAHLPVDDNVCKQLLSDIKEKAETLKRSITKEELFGLYTEIYSRKKKFSVNYKL
jgi:homocitrate synthase NifV